MTLSRRREWPMIDASSRLLVLMFAGWLDVRATTCCRDGWSMDTARWLIGFVLS